jgi:hypothetical protein
MKVQELIERLSQYEPDMDIVSFQVVAIKDKKYRDRETIDLS